VWVYEITSDLPVEFVSMYPLERYFSLKNFLFHLRIVGSMVSIPHALSWPPSCRLSLFAEQRNHPDPPHPPLSTRFCSSNHLPYTWTRAKQNKRGCPNQWLVIFFWKERTSKTRQVGLLGLPEQKIITSMNFWDGPVCCCKIVDFDGGARRHPSRRRD
jgi:hypothetical protein